MKLQFSSTTDDSSSSSFTVRPVTPDTPSVIAEDVFVDIELALDHSTKKVQSEESPQPHNEDVRGFQRRHFFRNLLLMTCVQLCCLFNFNLLNYLTNRFEQVYLTGVMSLSSELASIFFAGLLLEKLGTRLSLVTCYLTSAIGGILMLAYGLNNVESIAFPIIFLVCRFGVSGINVLYVACNARIFDVEQSVTAFGLASFFARMSLSGAPLISTLDQPTPMMVFTLTTVVAAAISYFVKVHPSLELRNSRVKPIVAEDK